MRFFILAFSLFALAWTGVAEAADRVPSFDIARNCRSEAAGVPNSKQSLAECQRDETDAKKQLNQEWPKFGPEPRKTCLELSSIGGEQSYVELQTCLEMSSNSNMQTSGASNAPRK
jgi:hypothetical protein